LNPQIESCSNFLRSTGDFRDRRLSLFLLLTVLVILAVLAGILEVDDSEEVGEDKECPK